MIPKNSFTILLICLLTTSLVAKRHSLHKKAERAEARKKVVQQENQSLSSVLSKQTKNMAFAEAQQAKEYYVKEKESEMIIKCGQRLLAVGGDQEVMRITRLELAELFLQKQNYTEAEKYAQEYQKYYPGAKEIRRADYIAIQANYLSKLSIDRDQQKTRTTIELSKQFLEKHPRDTEYAQEVKRIMHDCYASLIQNELHIINTQLNTFNHTGKEMSLTAAQKRLAYVKEHYHPHAPEISLDTVERRYTDLAKSVPPQLSTPNSEKEKAAEPRK